MATNTTDAIDVNQVLSTMDMSDPTKVSNKLKRIRTVHGKGPWKVKGEPKVIVDRSGTFFLRKPRGPQSAYPKKPGGGQGPGLAKRPTVIAEEGSAIYNLCQELEQAEKVYAETKNRISGELLAAKEKAQAELQQVEQTLNQFQASA